MEKILSFIQRAILGAILMSGTYQSLPLNVTRINCEDVQLCTVGVEFCLKREAKCGYCEDYKQNCFKPTAIDGFYQGCSSYCAEEKSKNNIEKLKIAGCSPPSPPENGNFSGSFAYQDKVNFECHDGYKMEGYPEITCGNFSQWSAPPPKCIVQECHPPHLEDGAIEGTDYTPGNRIKFHCNPGYTLVGPGSLACNGDGLWDSNVFPNCIAGNQMLTIISTVLGVVGVIALVSIVINIWQYIRYRGMRSGHVNYKRTSVTHTSNGIEVTYEGSQERIAPTAPLLSETSASNGERKEKIEEHGRQGAEGILPNDDETERGHAVTPNSSGQGSQSQRRREATDGNSFCRENEWPRNNAPRTGQTSNKGANIIGNDNHVDQSKNGGVTMKAGNNIYVYEILSVPTNENQKTPTNTDDSQDQPVGNMTDPIQETGEEKPEETNTKARDSESISNEGNQNKDDGGLTEVTVEAGHKEPSEAAVGNNVFNKELLSPQKPTDQEIVTEITSENGHRKPGEAAVRGQNCSKTLLAESGRQTGYSKVTVEDGHAKPSELAVRGLNSSTKALNILG